MSDESDRPWEDPLRSSFWKAIGRVAASFNCSTHYQIGNGKGTKFWSDNWQQTPLRFLYPNLYQATPTKHYSVNQLFNDGDWNLQLQMITPAAHLEKEELTQKLQQVRLLQTPDRPIWLRKGDSFTVSSMYNFLAFTPSPTSTIKSIWKIKAPPRVLIFTWLMLNNRLTTIDNLVRRGWYLPNMCVMCKSNAESAAHLFGSCSFARQIRNYIHTTFSTQFPMSLRFNTEASIEVLTDPKETDIAKKWEITTVFVLWRERCRRIFSDQTTHHLQLVREIRAEYISWFARMPIRIIHDPG